MYRVILFTICVACLPLIQARSVSPAIRYVPPVAADTEAPVAEEPIRVPYSEEMIKDCHGMPCDNYERLQEKLSMIMDIQAELSATEAGDWIGPEGIKREMPSENGTLDGCIWLTEEQADQMLEDTVRRLEERMHGRKKRTLDRNIPLGWNKWNTNQPIKFKFNNQHSESEKEIIRGAFRHWEENTCVRYQEIPFEQRERDNHLMITKEATGCHSYVGRTIFIPQVINLQASCLWQFGIAVHEIGHSLGMWHEQQRYDRDNNIRILNENLGSYVSQFTKLSTVDYGVPYDAQSVMHYSAKDGSRNGRRTMEHINPLFTQSFGQRTGLSFYNAKMINAAYCANTCDHSPLRQPCQRGGYQDPNDCSRCKCPDGWEGSFCESLAGAKVDSCGGTLTAATYDQEITSTGYTGRNYYLDRTECNWHVKAPQGYKIQLRFEGNFAVYCHYHEQCFHWVEVKNTGNLDEPGPRFCCYRTPTAVMESEGGEMLVLLRANYTTPWTTARRGFKAIYKAVRDTNFIGNPPTQTPTTTTTSTTTTTTTTQPTTWRPPPPPPSGGPLFSCSFENDWCGTLQDRNDQFDWKMTNRPTPSNPTGPNYAYSGDYFLFIEASKPRQPNDEATLLLPRLSYSGQVCVRFRYHMYGFHIGTLRAFMQRHGEKSVFFAESGEKGDRWLLGQISVNLQYYDQIGFTAVRGHEYSGDIGLDDVTVTPGYC